ncbi:MAG TPA: cell wall hydrolase [Clostridia bacterium]|nr:cell wall hydrolase [Clostridia bacterium]HPB16263.1 cell wall hydrolase [Clostridia bacterium]HQM96593.1 cell wall hydrolase [Clostridia bacterium]HQO69209.1 cell wall hydrolase [Clostridia bacterium]
MKKSRKLLSVAVCVLIVMSVVIQGFATENKLYDNVIVKTDEYNSITLSWKKTNSIKTRSYDKSYINLYEVLKEVEVNNETYIYDYNESNNRISKKIDNEIIARYEYDNNLLIKEISDNYTLVYFYNEFYELSGFVYNDSNYYYVKDKNNNITGINDSNGNTIYEYSYDGNNRVYNDIERKTIDSINDYIGSINKFRYNSNYYDEETGYYYNGLFYYDIINGRLSVREKDDKVPDLDDIVNKYTNGTKNWQDTELIVANWHDELMNDPDYGEDLLNTGNNPWYSGLDDIEVVARVLYGENSANYYDQTCIMWVFYNRFNNSSYLNTYYEVVTQENQFSGINTDLAKYPSYISGFSNATYLACLISTTNNLSEISTIDYRPPWMTSNYIFFRGMKTIYAENRLRDYNGQLQLLNGTTWINIYDAYIITTTGTSYLIDEVSDGLPYCSTFTHNLFYVN